MHAVFMFLFLCGLAALAWWLLRDADRFVEEADVESVQEAHSRSVSLPD